MDENKAKQLVQPMLKGCTITRVEDFGDLLAIYFVNDAYYQSGKIEDMAIGSGPIILVKSSGEVFRTGSGQTTAEYVEAYRESGHVYGSLSETLEIRALPEQVTRKQCILDLKKAISIDISVSKAAVDKLLTGEFAEFSFADENRAQEAQQQLSKIGFSAKQRWRRPEVKESYKLYAGEGISYYETFEEADAVAREYMPKKVALRIEVLKELQTDEADWWAYEYEKDEWFPS